MPGAMENAAAVTILEDYVFRSRVTDASYEVRANTVLHELAHMWFGDLVTMTWWDDLWLNESFAEWAAHWVSVKATRYDEAWTSFLNQRKAWGYRQDQLPTTHPIVADMVDLEAVEVNFDGITYAKGASALKQLVAWVGEDQFLAGIRSYFAKHAWGNTTLDDLLVELEASSGRELREWSTQWLETSGVNLLRPVVETSEDGATYARVAVAQEPPSSPEGVAPTLRSHRIALGLYTFDESGRLVRTGRHEIDVTGGLTEVPELTGTTVPDLLLLNDDDLTFAKIRLDPRSLQTAVDSLGSLAESLPPRAALGCGVGHDPRRGAVDRRVPAAGAVGSRGRVRHRRGAADRRAAAVGRGAVRRPEQARRLPRRVRCGPTATAGGGRGRVDHQLAFARGFAANARTVEHAAVLTSCSTRATSRRVWSSTPTCGGPC